MPDWEQRFSEVRFDLERREISGVAMPYNTVGMAPFGEELFESRAFGPDIETADVILDEMHERARLLARTGGGGLVLTDTPDALMLTATLPNTRASDDALELLSTKVLRGLSVAFKATKERFEGRRRIVQAARLGRIAVVDVPAYPDATVAIRSRSDRRRSLWL